MPGLQKALSSIIIRERSLSMCNGRGEAIWGGGGGHEAKSFFLAGA